MLINELTNEIEKLAKSKDLTRTQLAALLGISENYLYRIKKGDRNPGRGLLSAIIREFPELQSEVLDYMYNSFGRKATRTRMKLNGDTDGTK